MKSQQHFAKLTATNWNKENKRETSGSWFKHFQQDQQKGDLFREHVSMSFYVRCQHVKTIVFCCNNKTKNQWPNCCLTDTQLCPNLPLITSWNCLKMQISNSIFRPHSFIWATSMWPFCTETHKNVWPLCHIPTPNQKSILKGFQHDWTTLTRRDKVPVSRASSPKFFLPSPFLYWFK